MAKRISLRTPEPDYVVEAEAVRIGPDILVYVWGGERPHLSYVGHKEDGVAKEMAEALSARFKTNAVVTAGIHWDDLPADGIQIIVERCREITAKVIEALERDEASSQ
jgi:hypothetical protein